MKIELINHTRSIHDSYDVSSVFDAVASIKIDKVGEEINEVVEKDDSGIIDFNTNDAVPEFNMH